MAKVSFSKLATKINNNVTVVEFNGQEIEVKQYLPINDKLQVVENVLNQVIDRETNHFINPGQIETFRALEILYAYTNINFTDKMKEDPARLFDMVYSSGLYAAIREAISSMEYYDIDYFITETIKQYYTYRHSVVGILDTISADYSNLDLDASAIQEKLADPDNLTLVKDILTKLG